MENFVNELQNTVYSTYTKTSLLHCWSSFLPSLYRFCVVCNEFSIQKIKIRRTWTVALHWLLWTNAKTVRILFSCLKDCFLKHHWHSNRSPHFSSYKFYIDKTNMGSVSSAKIKVKREKHGSLFFFYFW